jgi:hypothetical protein
MSITENRTIIKSVEVPEAIVNVHSNGIIHVHYKMNTILDKELHCRMVALYNELTGGVKSNFIFSADEGLIFTKDARENASELEKHSPIHFYAVVVNSLPYKIIANFYFKVLRPKGRYKLVSSVEEGFKWLDAPVI